MLGSFYGCSYAVKTIWADAAAGEGTAASDAFMWINSPGNTETDHKASNIMPFCNPLYMAFFPLSFIVSLPYILYSPSMFIFYTLLVFPPYLLLVAANSRWTQTFFQTLLLHINPSLSLRLEICIWSSLWSCCSGMMLKDVFLPPPISHSPLHINLVIVP